VYFSLQQQVSAVHGPCRGQACHAAAGVAIGGGGVLVGGGGMPDVCGPVCGHDIRRGRGPTSCEWRRGEAGQKLVQQSSSAADALHMMCMHQDAPLAIAW
jgi:hypothetical protein